MVARCDVVACGRSSHSLHSLRHLTNGNLPNTENTPCPMSPPLFPHSQTTHVTKTNPLHLIVARPYRDTVIRVVRGLGGNFSTAGGSVDVCWLLGLGAQMDGDTGRWCGRRQQQKCCVQCENNNNNKMTMRTVPPTLRRIIKGGVQGRPRARPGLSRGPSEAEEPSEDGMPPDHETDGGPFMQLPFPKTHRATSTPPRRTRSLILLGGQA